MGGPAASATHLGPMAKAARWSVSVLITLILWAYFTAGFVLFFSPFYIWAAIFATDRVASFRRLNNRFCRGFFGLARLLMPGWRWQVDPRVKALQGRLIVCNHVSYFDSILLISLFGQHTTIAKARLFAIPIFGRMLRASGYLPSEASATLAGLMVERMERLPEELVAGANLFVFPEGTRSRDGRIGAFHSSIFKIARKLERPIEVLAVRNTERLFRPGSFVFKAFDGGSIILDRVGTVPPAAGADLHGKSALAAMMTDTRKLLENHLRSSN